MTSTAIIEEIKQLSPTEQVRVIRFTSELARKRQFTAVELGELADRFGGIRRPRGDHSFEVRHNARFLRRVSHAKIVR